jgi:5-methylcytosine-specific restriction endonuclease McrA
VYEAERKAALDRERPGKTARGYGHAWQALRKRYLAQHPYCSVTGCMALATDVDHITSVRDRPDLKLQWWNLRSYCHRHHSRRTARDQGFARRKPSDGEPRA